MELNAERSRIRYIDDDDPLLRSDSLAGQPCGVRHPLGAAMSATLAEGRNEAGNYSVQFNAAGLERGMYFCTLSTDITCRRRRCSS